MSSHKTYDHKMPYKAQILCKTSQHAIKGRVHTWFPGAVPDYIRDSLGTNVNTPVFQVPRPKFEFLRRQHRVPVCTRFLQVPGLLCTCSRSKGCNYVHSCKLGKREHNTILCGNPGTSSSRGPSVDSRLGGHLYLCRVTSRFTEQFLL